jgi:hypothetical protein
VLEKHMLMKMFPHDREMNKEIDRQLLNGSLLTVAIYPKDLNKSKRLRPAGQVRK